MFEPLLQSFVELNLAKVHQKGGCVWEVGQLPFGLFRGFLGGLVAGFFLGPFMRKALWPYFWGALYSREIGARGGPLLAFPLFEGGLVFLP